MARLAPILGLLLYGVLPACGDDHQQTNPTTERRRVALERSPLPKSPPPRPPSPFNDAGELQPAAELVLGTPVPRVARETSRRQRQVSLSVEEVPFDAVERFYRRRLTTGRVETGARGTSFIDARPRDSRDALAKVNVFLRRSARATSISIFDETPSRQRLPQSPEAIRAMAFPRDNE